MQRGVGVIAAVAAASLAHVTAFAADCTHVAHDRMQLARDALVAVDVEALSLKAGRDAQFDDDTEIAAARVRLGPGASAYDVTSTDVVLAAGAEIRGATNATTPPAPPACDVAPVACGGAPITVADGADGGSLAPGTYGDLILGDGARLAFAGGSYVFCSLSLGRDARLTLGGTLAAAVAIAGDVVVGRGADVFLAASPPPALDIAGESVRIGAGARLNVVLRAPSARLKTGRGASLRGTVCVDRLVIARDGRLSCHVPRTWTFTDVTSAAGIDAPHAWSASGLTSFQFETMTMSGGVAAGDFDRDGWVDLYTIGSELDRNRLFRNLGDGTFAEIGQAAGVSLDGTRGCGPAFADWNGDGHLDLFVGGVVGRPATLFVNDGDSTFTDATAASGVSEAASVNHFGAAFGDADGDGDLDMAVAHWGTITPGGGMEHLWRNDGDGTFSPGTQAAGLSVWNGEPVVWTFAPNFADMNGDGAADLLYAADFETEEYFVNAGAGVFTRETSSVNSAENAMGSAVGDYDNDGDLDWFLTSIWDPNGVSEGYWGVTGNRLYRNMGDGTLEDATDDAGVREGYWGWAACFADFDLDGNLDIFHTNGFGGVPEAAEFENDPSLLYVSAGDGTFVEQAAALGLDDVGSGRGVVCFDYDRDGDVDVFVSRNNDAGRLYRNDLEGAGGYLVVRLIGHAPNTEAIGSRVIIEADGVTQVREIRVSNNYASQDPAIAHFGLGTAAQADVLTVVWPDGETSTMDDVAANNSVTISQP